MRLVSSRRDCESDLGRVAEHYTSELGMLVAPVHGATEGECTCELGGACDRAGKHLWTDRGAKDATSEPEVIRRMLAARPGANLGALTGRKIQSKGFERIVVLDVQDPQAEAALSDLERRALAHGGKRASALPETLTCLTGSGGRHLYFIAADKKRVPCSHGRLGPGLDVLGDGGYVVTAGSIHETGRRYRWDQTAPAKMAAAPPWLLRAMRDVGEEAVGDEGGSGKGCEDDTGAEEPAPIAIIGEQRVPHLLARARVIRGLGMSLGSSRALLLQENRAACKPPLERGVLDREVLGLLPSFGRVSIEEDREGGDVTMRFSFSASGRPKPLSRDELLGHVGQSGKDGEGTEGSEGASEAGEVDDSWLELIANDKNGWAKPSAGNAALFLCNRHEWQGVLAYDELSCQVLWLKDPPDGGAGTKPAAGRAWREEDITYVQHWLTKVCGPDIKELHVWAGVMAAARKRAFHPVRDYLESITWDGEPRAAGWLRTYLGCNPSLAMTKAGVWWLVSAVARVMDPGCQADHMLVLESAKQGVGKSSAARILASDEWFTDDLRDVNNKDTLLAMQGKWIIEIAELDALRYSAASRVKSFTSRRIDRFREPYAHHPVNRPRQCVFIGTTNESNYLQDSTGARRFWCIKTGWIERAALRQDRDQLWAEAKALYDQGEHWWPERDEAAELEVEMRSRGGSDLWTDIIAEKFCRGAPASITLLEVARGVLDLDISKSRPSDAKRIASSLRMLGWQPRPEADAEEKRRGQGGGTSTNPADGGLGRWNMRWIPPGDGEK